MDVDSDEPTLPVISVDNSQDDKHPLADTEDMNGKGPCSVKAVGRSFLNAIMESQTKFAHVA